MFKDKSKTNLIDVAVLCFSILLLGYLFSKRIAPNIQLVRDGSPRFDAGDASSLNAFGGPYEIIMSSYQSVIMILLLLIAYGFYRQMRRPSNLHVFSLIAAPACTLGMCLVMVQSLNASFQRGPVQINSAQELEMDARQMWAALLWTRENTENLPGWTWGGSEKWPLPGGGVIDVIVDQSRVSVQHSGVGSEEECIRMVDALDRSRPQREVDSMLLVNGQLTGKDGCLSGNGLRKISLDVIIDEHA